MGKVTDIRRNIQKQTEKEVLEEIWKRLEVALELKHQGKEEDGNKMVDDLINWLKNLIEEEENKLKQTKPHNMIDRSSLPQMGKIVAVGDKIFLRVVQVAEKEKYLSVTYEYSVMKSMYKDESFRETMWKEFLSENSFVCSVYDKASSEYVGYCSIKDMEKSEWELAIELKSEFCKQGYGSEALMLLMKSVHNLTGRRFFRARVDVDNYASQKLMKKLKAIPNGISEYLLHGEEIEKFQMEYKDMITDEMREVAEEFCMEAEDLLGYVLEYRFDMETNEYLVVRET